MPALMFPVRSNTCMVFYLYQVKSVHTSPGLKSQSPFPTGLFWVFGLAFKAPGELPLLCSPAYSQHFLKLFFWSHLSTVS